MREATLDRQSNPESVRGYAFYDWGKSAFETSVTTAVLPAWFAYLFLKANGLEAEILGRNMTSDAVWSVAVAIGALLVAIASPSLGVIADRRAIKMWWLRILTYLGGRVNCCSRLRSNVRYLVAVGLDIRHVLAS